MTHSRYIVWLCGLLVIALAAGAASGQSVDLDQLKKQFKERYPRLSQLKKEAKVGETWQGFVAAIDPGLKEDQKAWSVIADENRDREVLYQLVAEEIAADPEKPKRAEIAPQVIAERNASRNFERASSTALLRVAEGIWVTKKNRPWLLRLQKLEAQGRIGEGRDGYVAAVRDEFARDDEIRKIVERENQARNTLYERMADDQDLSVEKVAREQAQRYFDAAHAGVFLQSNDGAWRPKPRRSDGSG